LAPVVDGLTGSKNIANLFASNLERVFNTYSPSPHSSVYSSSMSVSDLCEVQFSEDDVLETVSQLKPNKSDADGLFSEHFLQHLSLRFLLSSLHLFYAIVTCLNVFMIVS
jgi:hypothetical protein